ncbi:MAG: hypothetical protein OXF79_08905 [Chloroflexi bacterium]|nr:hypothetical protein [Chloroflexota bacterium]
MTASPAVAGTRPQAFGGVPDTALLVRDPPVFHRSGRQAEPCPFRQLYDEAVVHPSARRLGWIPARRGRDTGTPSGRPELP